MGMTTAEFNSFMTKETEEKKRRESGNAALSPSASQPDPQTSEPAPSTGRVSKADFNSYMTQKAKADNFNTYGADYDRWIDDVNAFGKNASNQTQSWKDAGTASALVAQNRESAAALKTRGQGIYNFFTNYADDIDASNGAGTAQRVLDSITSAQKGIDDTQSYVDYVTQGWAAAPDAETYANYQSWAQNPRSSADVIKDIESANARISELKNKASGYNKGIEAPKTSGPEWATTEASPRAKLDAQRNAAREATISAHDDLVAEEQRLATLRQELKFRQDNETYEKQQRWKEGRRGVQAINVNLDTVNGNIADLEREEGRLAGVLNDLEGQKYDPAFDQAYYDRVKAQHDGITKQLDELKTVQKDLSDELSYNKYLDREDERAEWAKYANNADFAEKSQYTPTGFGKEDINYAPKLDYLTALILSGFNPAAADLLYNGSQLLNPDDADRDREVTYGLVNRDAAAFTQNFANKAPNEVLLGQIPTDGIEYYQMSQDERATYNYLYATDKAKADEYMEWLYPQLTERQRDAETKAVHDWTQENAANAIVGNVASVLTSPLKALSYGSQAADLIKTGKIDENAGYNRYSYLNNAVREATSENWGEVGTFAYQTGMSMADFLWNAFITGGLSGGGAVAENLSLAIMGASAAADTVIEQKDRGMDDTRAFTLGTVAGLAEIVTEKVSLEALLKPDLSKGAFSYLIKNVLAEGSEEGASDLINYFADDLYDLISGQDASKWHEAINSYRAQGYTESEAFGRALADRAGEVGLDMLGGALSGGVMAGGSLAINAYQNSEGFKDKQSGKDLADMKLTPDRYTAMVENGLEAPEGSEVRRTAEAIQAKLDAGKDVKQAEYGKLWRLTNEAIDEAIRGDNSQRGAESAPNASEGNYTPVSANAALTKADEVSTGNAALDETLRAISEAGTVTNAQARTIIADRTMLDALSEITGIDLSSVGQPASAMTASEQRAAVKNAAMQAAEIVPSKLNNVDSTENSGYNNQQNGGDLNVTGRGAQEAGNGMGGREGFLEQVASGGEDASRNAAVSPFVRVSSELQNAYNSRGIVNLEMHDVSGNNAAFSSALNDARNTDAANGWCVTPKSTEDLASLKSYMTQGGGAGFAISQDGDIEAVFKNKTAGVKGALDTLIPTALENGGTKLDCYGEMLADYYSRYGFIPVARVEFNEAYANPGWDNSKGTPDIYFMMHNGDSAADVISKKGTYKVWSKAELEALPLFNKESYEAAYAYRDSLMKSKENSTPAVSPESSVGAATRGFVDNPNPGEIVPSQNKSVTTNPFLTDDEKLEYNPAHERISTAERNRRADNMFVAYDDAGTIRNWDEVAADLMSKKAWTAEEQKAANKIFEQYRKEARRTGDYEKLNEFALAKSRIGHSEAGASLQALKEFSHNGDGLVQQSIEILDNPKIDEDIRDAETKRILDVSEKFDNAEVFNDKGEVDKAATMENFADLVLEVAEARNNIKDRNDVRKTITWALDTVMKTGDVDFMRDLAWGSLVASIQDNIPIPASEAIKSLRRDFMLSKVSTAMRNIVSNMTFDLIDGISRNISVPLDILVSKFTGTRSIAKTDIISKAKMKAQVDAFAKSFLEVAFNVSAEGAASGYGAAGNRTFRMSGGPVEQVLSRMEQYLNLAMYSTDQFQKGGIRESVQSGIDELYEKGLIKDESLREAGDIEMLYRTFQKDGKLASALKGFRDWLNNLSSGFVPGSFQLGDIVMPFVQVPANLVSAAVDYTPLGILKEAARLVVQSRKGKLTAAHQARMVQAIGRSLNGSAVIALAAIAKAIGALTVSDDGRDRDKDKTALDTQAGLSGTQLNLSALIRAFSGEDVTRQEGDLLVNIGFMDPLNALLTIGSLFHDEVTDEDGYKLGDLAGKSVAGTLQSVKDMPMMGAIDELYSAINNSAEEDWGARAVDAGLRYAANQVSSFVPNALKGIAQGTDPYQRDLYSKDDVGGRALDSILASIPGLRETLPVKQDSFGEDMDTGNWWLNFLNNNLLPGRVNQYSPRQEGIKTVLDAVSDATGEVGFYPDRYAPKTIDGHKLSYEEKRAYKKAYGDAFKEAMSETGDMSDLTIEEVTDILTNINNYARGTAKEAVSDGYTYKPSGNSYVRGSEALDSVGIPIADYYTYYKDIGDIKKKYDTTDERKKRVIEYINEHKTLTTEQKKYLWHETAGYDSKSPWES